LLLEQNIDLAVVDLNLPDRSGLELIHQAKQSGKAVKILAITGALGDVYLEIATFLGADRAIRKLPGGLGNDFAAEEWTNAIDVMLQ